MASDDPNVFIGTMFCGEGDFSECLMAINRQKGVNISHKIISNQPERQAHDSLWDSFRRAAADYQMLVKIDADTVLAHDRVLTEIYELFRGNPRVTSVQAPLHDFFTDGNINGLNCFSPRVQFNTSPELYCDRVDTGHDIQLRAGDVPDSLNPAGFHCYHANEIQAFHYGLHRALKNQNDVQLRLARAFNEHKDRIRWFALQGFAAAHDFRDHKGFNYQDERFMEAFQRAQVAVNV